MFPFNDNVGHNVTGKNLKRMIKLITRERMRYFCFSGIKMKGIVHDDSFWEIINEKIVFKDETSIEDHKSYSLASNEFLLNGGDDMNVFKINGTMSINSTQLELKMKE